MAFDNLKTPTNFQVLLVENAMLAGAALAIEQQVKGDIGLLCEHAIEPYPENDDTHCVPSNWCPNCHAHYPKQ